MAKKQEGFFWHVHHEVLFEWCFSYAERVDYIKINKPRFEQATRHRLFQPVKGKLPEEVVKVWQVHVEAWQVLTKAQLARVKAWQVLTKERRDFDKTLQDYFETIRKNMPQIEKLHSEECPNCPWDGHTIFPN